MSFDCDGKSNSQMWNKEVQCPFVRWCGKQIQWKNEKQAQIRNGQVALEQSTKVIKQYQKRKSYSREKKLITKNKRQEW